METTICNEVYTGGGFSALIYKVKDFGDGSMKSLGTLGEEFRAALRHLLKPSALNPET